MTQRRRPDPSPQIQPLEARRLLASFATLSAGTLTLTGTSGNDTFNLLERSGKLRVIRNGIQVQFVADAVTNVIATLDAGNDSLVMNSALTIPATVFGGDGNDTISTSVGADRIEGGNGEDWIYCGYGSDRVYGGKEYDTLSYQGDQVGISVTNTVKTEEIDPLPIVNFDEFLSGQMIRPNERDRHSEFERIEGSDATDSLKLSVFFHFYYWEADRRRFELDGRAGDDSVFYLSPDSVPAVKLIGGAGNDHFTSGVLFTAPPIIDAGPGFDSYRCDYVNGLYPYTMPDQLEELIIPSGFNGEITGNSLANHILITEGSISSSIKVDGRGGDDRLIIYSTTSSTNVSAILGGTGNDRIEINARLEDQLSQPAFVYGGSGNDTILGGSANDTLRGDGGDDLIYGGDGADRLYGGDGNDTIDGQSGRDFIYGGAGNDRGKKQSTDRAFDSIELLL